jgi:hypothetical protein
VLTKGGSSGRLPRGQAGYSVVCFCPEPALLSFGGLQAGYSEVSFFQ